MSRVGILLSDVPRAWGPKKQFDALMRQVEAAQRNGFSYITIGQHFLYGDLTWLQPAPVLARLAAEVDRDTRLVTTIIVTALHHPVVLAEELATLDIVTEGRLIFGSGLGYRSEEFELLGIPFKQRVGRTEEGIELIQRLWTEEVVDHDGKYFTVRNGRPHIRPWQEPRIPIWIGAHSRPGVARAGRIGDRWTIPPETEVDEIKERLEIFNTEQEARGLKPSHQPLRRNVFVANDRESAIADFIRVSKDRYLTYAKRGLDVLDERELERDFLGTAGKHAILGSPDEVVEQLASIVREIPVDPLLIRPGWPTMEPDEVVEYLDRFGTQVMPALRELEPLPLMVGGPS
jgi:alkanesulfonate monooxygenase SsuD/methylene tetrahydromethanopterin reductase-like flavin-dependent oxidoreductase (luciferase family)